MYDVVTNVVDILKGDGAIIRIIPGRIKLVSPGDKAELHDT